MSEMDKLEKRATEARKEAAAATETVSKLKAENTRASRELADWQQKASTAITRFEDYKTKVAVRESPSRRALVDISGGTTAFSATALLNWLFRTAARKFPDTWIARHIDLIQGVPHFFIGAIAYGAELMTRGGHIQKDAKWLPSGWREGLSEASKVFAELGAANILRAIRVRLVDGREDRVAMAAELARLKQQMESGKSGSGG